MRTPRRVLVPTVVVVLGLCVLPAVADEAGAPVADAPAVSKPDPEVALFISESLLPGEKDEPEGWTLLDDVTPGATGPEEDTLVAMGEALDLNDDNFYVQMQSYKKGGATVTIAMVDVDAKVYAYKAALAPKAAEKGWQVSEMGHPGRILVIGGPAGPAAELAKKLNEHVVYTLAGLGVDRVNGAKGKEPKSQESALKYAKYVEVLAPGAGAAQVIVGFVHLQRSFPTKPKEKPKRDEQEKAVAHFGKALADGVAFPPKKRLLVFAAGRMGSIILTWKKPALLEKATKALEVAVEHERENRFQAHRYGNRYNLACAYARAKRIDDAFKTLESCLEMLKNMPPSAWREHHKHAEEKDEDMAPLRQDPRFSELMNRFKPPAKKKRPMPKKEPPTEDK